MKKIERRQVEAICKHVLRIAERTKGTANKEVLQQPVARLKMSLQEGRFREAEDLAYGILMECQGVSSDGNEEEAAEGNETSKAPRVPVRITVNIGRSIKFIRVAAGMKQGEMAKRLGISQNYLSLLENNRAEPSLSLLKKISTEFNVPVSFLLLESSVEFESKDPEKDTLLKDLKELIHRLQKSRIEEERKSGEGEDSTQE